MTASENVPPPQAMPEKIPSIYADYQATTPLDPRVSDAMLPHFIGEFGNPHSLDNPRGKAAAEAVERARERIASVIHATSREIIFTSGATESNNLAILGAAEFHAHEGDGKRRHIISVVTEHMSVLAPIKHLRSKGFDVTVLPVQQDGLLDIEQFESALRNDTLLVSVMAVNNEIGVIQDIASIGALCRRNGTLFHVDAAQGFARMALDMQVLPVDLLSISAHKIYGPMGIGALYIRRNPRARIGALLHGGAQEETLRSGTVPLPLAVGFGEAANIMALEGLVEEKRLLALRERFISGLAPVTGKYRVNGSLERRIAGNISLCFPQADILPRIVGVEASRGSACNSGGDAASYVIRALGVEEGIARTAIRFGFGRFSDEQQVDAMAKAVIATLG